MRSLLCAVVVACLVSNAVAVEGFFDYQSIDTWPVLCRRGRQQSPINIDTAGTNTDARRSRDRGLLTDATPAHDSAGRAAFETMGTLSRYTVLFTGTALRVDFDEFSVPADVRIPANEFKIGTSTTVEEGDLLAIEPLYMIFHTLSEHTIDGFHAPGELQIVARIKEGESDYCDISGGCLAVFAMMLTFDGDGTEGSRELERLFNRIPRGMGVSNEINHRRALDLDALIPGKTEYYTYLGSLTTPPCREIVTWHVYTKPVHVSAELIEKHQDMVSFTPGEDCTFLYSGVCSPPREKTNYRPIQKHHGRDILFVHEEE